MRTSRRLMYFLIFSFVAASSAANAQTLPNWAGVQLKLWNYANPFFPAEWNEAKLGAYNWKAANAEIVSGTLNLSVTERASGEVQGNTFAAKGRWEVEVTLPKMAPGLVAAPLWLMSKDANADEIDFEFVGTKGLTITAWTKVNGAKKAVYSMGSDAPLIKGDLSGKSYKLGIEYDPGNSITWYVNGKQIARITPVDTGGLFFPSLPLKPYFDLWVADGLDPLWAGQWTPMASGSKLTMKVTGYKFTPL
ncbi:family 16 glycosylhydrolase [Hyphomicrobiales bacterium]